MLDQFDTPLNSTILPYGISATERWLREAAKHLHLENEAEELIKREYEAIRIEFEEAKKYLAGKLAIVEGHEISEQLKLLKH